MGGCKTSYSFIADAFQPLVPWPSSQALSLYFLLKILCKHISDDSQSEHFVFHIKWTEVTILLDTQTSDLKKMLIDFRERGRQRERERNIDVRNIDWLPLVCAPTRDRAHNLGMCPDQESNPKPSGGQRTLPAPEPHLPGQRPDFFFNSEIIWC